jgi:exodeoxyribonuclease VII large subunit
MQSSLDLTPPDRDIYTPSRLNREARTLLEHGLPSLWLEGELSNFSRPTSGHWYFSLKDANAQLRCAMFRQRNSLAQLNPKDGMRVLARGRVSLYEPRGDYQLLVEHMEEAGEGALRRQFELLKTKLAAAGWFAAERKRPLPKFPRRIGVITSPTGAAVRDILHVLRRRFASVPVLIYPVPVQGAQAAGQIAAAISLAGKRCDCDVLILARGGGSLEDLWAFNEEVVARAIVECNIPIVTGIGHEVDFTIADLVADVRAPTPSGAAELTVPDGLHWLAATDSYAQRIAAAMLRYLAARRERSDWLQRRLAQLHPGTVLRQQAQRLDDLEQRARRALRQQVMQLAGRLATQFADLRRHSPALRLAVARGRLETLQLQQNAALQRRVATLDNRFKIVARALDTVSPLATLKRGYAIVADSEGQVLTNAASIAIGARIHAQLAQGSLEAKVEALLPPAKPSI